MKTVKQTTLYGNKELSDFLGWNEQKTHTYYKRGLFVEPEFVVGGRPAWSKKQVDSIVSQFKGKEA